MSLIGFARLYVRWLYFKVGLLQVGDRFTGADDVRFVPPLQEQVFDKRLGFRFLGSFVIA